jgi:uncharacterized protein
MTASALYEGTIRHRRFAVRTNEFRHRIAMAYIDLDELPRLLGGRLARKRGLVRFERSDYLGDPARPLDDEVRRVIAEQTGSPAPAGPVRILTHLRSYGHCFNPVSFYYCFEPDGRVGAVLAEVTNTPWGERHAYVLPRAAGERVLTGEMDKELHVSPFMGMAQRYRFSAPAPGETLSVHIASSEAAERAFDATLSLTRRELTRRSLADVTVRYPAATLRMLVLIYGHALGLRLRGVRPHPHPRLESA